MSAAEAYASDEGDGSALLSNIHAILWQRKWLLLVPFVLCSIAGVAAAFLLPRSYESRAVLLVESQSLPVDIGTNGSVGEVIDRRIARIREQILSRPDLIALIQANDLYKASSHNQSLTDLVARMRSATDISPVEADIAPTRGGSSSIAFALTFNYPEPGPAQLVAQAFVDRLLRLDASETQKQAEDNVRFLQDQASSLQDQISAIEGEINRITGQNGMALANAGGSAFMFGTGATGFESQIAQIQRDNAQLSAQIGNGSVDRDPQVAAAEARLAAAKAIYADDHPDVKLAQSQLEAARRVASQQRSGDNDAAIRQQIANNNNLINQIRRQKDLQESRAATIMAAQARGPAVVQQVNQLQARADSLRGNLSRINASLVSAQSVVKLTGEQRAEHLTLIDPPVTPDKPTKPNRLILIAGGIFGGLALGLALVLLIELVMRPIRSVGTLTRLVGAPPLGVVPILSGKGSHPRTRGFRLWPFRRKQA
ncbi:GumC family protein [Sphingomonas quercus]|uniref:Lipopolysaccharide biosynthesis protein n=1 Tax=Sphingomonas quercus TaxID=2842451 RepID=A0ABS6BIY4_9SPHN|nr:Wzz/FepE/Etk N-terminal domain-containing protein [Sphingomonas quercus]MBU3077184.1 lipopolysaccharide biosynthesis protein [Sphingomonas quercus]